MAAGIGKGLNPITELIPKPLIPIANRPLIEHLICNFEKLKFTEIIVLVGYLKEQIKQFLVKIKPKSIKIRVISARNYEKGPLYTFHAIRNEDFEEDFILCPSDLFINQDLIFKLIKFHKQGTISIGLDSSKPINMGTKVFTYSESHLNSKNSPIIYGKISGFKNRVINEPGSSALAIPLIICPSSILRYIDTLLEQNKTKVISLLNYYIKKLKHANFIDLPNFPWFDVDSFSEILKANNFALNNNIKPYNHVILTKTGKISDFKSPLLENFDLETDITPPILIGENCRSNKDSHIGPYVSLDNNSELEEKVKIQNSIISGNSRVPVNSNIKNAIIYKNKQIIVN